MSGALERLGCWLGDEDWTVTVQETSLHAVKHPGVLYRSLSPLDRATRGTLACWFDGTDMHVRSTVSAAPRGRAHGRSRKLLMAQARAGSEYS